MTEVETYKGDAYCVKCKEKRDFEGTVKISDWADALSVAPRSTEFLARLSNTRT